MTYSKEETVSKKFRELTEPQHLGLGVGKLLNGGYENRDTVIIESANGPYLNDVMGNRYIDIGMGAGSMILGHAHQPIVEKVAAQAAKGSNFGQPAKHAYVLKEKILENMPTQYTGVVFCNSGSEATMRAIRLARAFSKKNGIAIFSGGWHGSHDAVLVGDDYESPEYNPAPKSMSTGTPGYLFDDVLMLPYNKPEAFELIRKEAHRLALIMIEPIQGSNPRSDIAPFLKELNETCVENGVLLAFDEIITGYRLSLGGAIEYFGIAPDIITYGKILGGGLPVGAVVLSKTIASRVFGKTSEPFFTGGTFSANPLTMEAGVEVLRCLKTSEYQYINSLSEFMRNSCNNYFQEKKMPIRIIGCNSISRIIFTDKKIDNRRARDRYELPSRTQALFRKLMILNGVLHPSNGLIFLSFAHSDAHVEKIIASIQNAANTMHNIGCFQHA